MTAPDSSLTDIAYWTARQPADLSTIRDSGSRPAWLQYVEPWFPRQDGRTCLEVGVLPGSTILYLTAHLGYACTGVDFSPKIRELRSVYADRRVRIELVEGDFNRWDPGCRFDVVYSNGFIEHFENYPDVVARHWDLVRDGGLLLLTVPTLTPVQYWLRRAFYEPERMRAMLASHNRRAMSLSALRRSVESCAGSEILVASYIREMAVWFGPDEKGIRSWSRPLFRPVRFAERVARRLKVSSPIYSPEALVLARKGQARDRDDDDA